MKGQCQYLGNWATPLSHVWSVFTYVKLAEVGPLRSGGTVRQISRGRSSDVKPGQGMQEARWRGCEAARPPSAERQRVRGLTWLISRGCLCKNNSLIPSERSYPVQPAPAFCPYLFGQGGMRGIRGEVDREGVGHNISTLTAHNSIIAFKNKNIKTTFPSRR